MTETKTAIDVIINILSIIPQDKILEFLLDVDILAYLFIGYILYKTLSLVSGSASFLRDHPALTGVLVYFAVMLGGIYIYYPSVLF